VLALNQRLVLEWTAKFGSLSGRRLLLLFKVNAFGCVTVKFFLILYI
jgi:hypothetical protein